jgi:hypothetical protein
MSTLDRYERWAIAALAGFAFIRVLVFAGAYPFFTNVDEHRHVDMVLKYASGSLPHPDRATYQPETGGLVAMYGSREYVQRAGSVLPPPLWEAPPQIRATRTAAVERAFRDAANLENFQSPAYYALGGGWLALGRALGLEGGRSLYWIRALNAWALAGLVLVAALLVRATHPGRPLLTWGVPALVACAPPDGLFYVTGDGVSMFAGGAAFAALVGLARAPGAPLAAYAGAGLAAAFALLVKAPNLVLLAGIVWLGVEAWRAGALRARAPALAMLVAGFALPAGAWMARCFALTGSALGTAPKVAGLGWGVRPVAEWLEHPLFSPSGTWAFLRDLVPMFWRGEVVWNREVLALPAADAFYGLTTLLFLGLALLAWRRSAGSARRAEGFAFVVGLGSVAVLAVLSLRFVFGERTNPPASHPYFVQGRLIAGAWLPFALLYVRGLEVALGALPASLRDRAGFVALGLVLGVCLGSEAWLARPAFASVYNVFHLPALP